MSTPSGPALHITPLSEIQIGSHVFPTQKYRLIRESLIARGSVRPDQFVEAEQALPVHLALVHSPEYLEDFLDARNSWRTNRSELPLRPDIIGAYTHGAQATISATQDALTNGRVGINIGGGFHHAFADHAEGFCYLNDVAIAVQQARSTGQVNRVAIVDLDVHQGNGTAHIFHGISEVFTFSMHQENNYPPKQQSDLDIGLDDGTPDDLYLSILSECLDGIFSKHQPELVHYLAGADPYWDDKLGGLNLTMDGLRQRDQMVLEACITRGIPVVVTLAGGYACDTRHTVAIHVATIEAGLIHYNPFRQQGQSG